MVSAFGAHRLLTSFVAGALAAAAFAKARLGLVVLGLATVATVTFGPNAVAQERAGPSERAIAQFGEPPAVPAGPLSVELSAAADRLFVETMRQRGWGEAQSAALAEIAASGDPRLAWPVSDLMRFASDNRLRADLAAAATALLGAEPPGRAPPRSAWGAVTDRLIAWDIPAPPDYLRYKREIFTTISPSWAPLFVEGDIDWRLVSWGGVPIDARPFGQTDVPCQCIPAADNPEVTGADEADWLDDDAIVFGVVINGEARAYPRRIMEVREMVNDTLGGRDIGMPYCTLCGAAQVYFTDALPPGIERPVLRTSGLLIRSNKVMFDLETMSVLDTFLGTAVTGPLHEKGLRLEQASVVTSRWGAWKAAHPETTVLAEALALGRDPDFRNGRDADGPIFPVGDVDPRLPAHEDVIGVVPPSGGPIAFQRAPAFAALQAGEAITEAGVRLELDGTGIRAVAKDGADLGSHEAFWFAWSQFHPGTRLWPQ